MRQINWVSKCQMSPMCQGKDNNLRVSTSEDILSLRLPAAYLGELELWIAGGVNIGGASIGRFGNTTPVVCNKI